MPTRRITVNGVPLHKFDKKRYILHEMQILLNHRNDIPYNIRMNIMELLQYVDYNLLYQYLYQKYLDPTAVTDKIISSICAQL